MKNIVLTASLVVGEFRSDIRPMLYNSKDVRVTPGHIRGISMNCGSNIIK